MFFKDIVGQQEVKSRLLKMVSDNRLPHALLFTGVDGSGNLEWAYNSKSVNTPIADAITVGAPYHFYFGLNNGKTAMNRFIKKCLNNVEAFFYLNHFLFY